jgi:threonine/homoserine/homoserine lactone efflux protein
MIGFDRLALFALTSGVLLLTPGPAVLFVVAQSLRGGRRAGLLSTLGLGAGHVVHLVAGALGISTLLATSPGLLRAVQLGGAGYLVYLGAGAVRQSRTREPAPETFAGRGASHPFREGLAVNLLNPKAALFLMAFLPQFLEPGSEHFTKELLVLGSVFVGMGLATDALYALLASAGHTRLRARPALRRALGIVSGVVLLALGLSAALVGPVDLLRSPVAPSGRGAP